MSSPLSRRHAVGMAIGLAAALAQASRAQTTLKPIKVGLVAGPQTPILEIVKTNAAREGLQVQIVEFADLVQPNEALAAGDIDANSFQHVPYLEQQMKDRGYKFTVIGEVRLPGSYVNYSEQLTIFEAIGRAGGITETGAKERVLVLRPVGNETTTYKINLQDKNLLASPAYFITPNDVVIVQPVPKKTFDVNLPTFAFIITSITSTITTTLLLIDFFEK